MDTTAKIARPFYVNWLDSWKDKDIIKVVTGIRQRPVINFLLNPHPLETL